MFQRSLRRGATAALAPWLLVIACVSATALAQSPTSAERAVEYRRALYKVLAGQFGPLAKYAQGKLEMPVAARRQYAERLAVISEFTREAYPDFSREGSTKARPTAWTDKTGFDAALEDFTHAASALASLAARPDASFEEVKAAIGAVGNTCKTCHDKFREK